MNACTVVVAVVGQLRVIYTQLAAVKRVTRAGRGRAREVLIRCVRWQSIAADAVFLVYRSGQGDDFHPVTSGKTVVARCETVRCVVQTVAADLDIFY